MIPPVRYTPMNAHDLMKMSQEELDDLFKSKPPGPIPSGEAEGTAIIAPGTVFSPAIAEMINIFAWKGKVFDPEHGLLRNRITLLGFQAIIAKVYQGKSWLDQKDCIVLDYSQTSTIAKHVRDEIREVEPGFYLGKVYWDEKRLINFCLQFPKS